MSLSKLCIHFFADGDKGFVHFIDLRRAVALDGGAFDGDGAFVGGLFYKRKDGVKIDRSFAHVQNLEAAVVEEVGVGVVHVEMGDFPAGQEGKVFFF